MYNQWDNEDRAAFQNINTIGRHVLFSCLHNDLIGYFSWDDRQFPNGIVGQNCILPGYQGQGYGTRLISHVIHCLENEGIKIVTIGVDETEEANVRLYHRLGFLDKIKDCYVDPCDVDENMQAKPCGKYWLLKREI